MGTFRWPLRISSMDGQQGQDIEATVDTGASFTTLPSSLLRELGIEATGKRGVPAGRRAARRDGLRAGVGHDRWRERSHHLGLWTGRDTPFAGGLHPGRFGPSGGPRSSTAGAHPHDPILGHSRVFIMWSHQPPHFIEMGIIYSCTQRIIAVDEQRHGNIFQGGETIKWGTTFS